MSTDPRSYHGANIKIVSDQVASEENRSPSATLYRGTEADPRGLTFDLERGVLRTGNETMSGPSQQEAARSNPFAGVETYSCYSRLGTKAPDNRVEATRELAWAITGAPRPPLPKGAKPVPSMYVYFGQFLAHEVSELYDVKNGEPQNLVSPALDLDTFFWKTKSPPADLQSEFAKFGVMHVGDTGVGPTSRKDILEHHDLPRDQEGNPLVPDKRSDSNLSLAQLQTRMTLNYLKRTPGLGEAAAQAQFLEDVQVVTLYDYLRRIINEATYNSVLIEGRKMVAPGKGDPGNWLLPLEFAAAAYRFGHAMVRHRYKWSHFSKTKPAQLFFLLGQSKMTKGVEPHPVYGNKVVNSDWKMDTKDMIGFDAPNTASPIAPHLALDLRRLAPVHVKDAKGKVNLAILTLELGRALGLASAQDIWSKFDTALFGTHLTSYQLKAGQSECIAAALGANCEGDSLGDRTPLWFYTLREAQLFGESTKLGPLAGRIVMETLHAAICTQRKGKPPADTGMKLADIIG